MEYLVNAKFNCSSCRNTPTARLFVSLEPEETGPHLAFNTVCAGLLKLVIFVYPQCTNTQNKHSLEVYVCVSISITEENRLWCATLEVFTPRHGTSSQTGQVCNSRCLQHRKLKKIYIHYLPNSHYDLDNDLLDT